MLAPESLLTKYADRHDGSPETWTEAKWMQIRRGRGCAPNVPR
jgi:hypothetical protein